MNISIESEDLSEFEREIKKEQKLLVSFPFAYALLFFICFLRNGGENPGFVFVIISLFALVIPYLYVPLRRGLKLKKVFYNIETFTDDRVQFTSFGTLWGEERIVIAELSEISLRQTTIQKNLFTKYEVKQIIILGETYLIFSELLPYLPKLNQKSDE